MSDLDRVDRLSERQKECLRRVGMGFTSKEIAQQLGISHNTVDTHIRACLEALQLSNRNEAARLLEARSYPQPLSNHPDRLVEPLVIPAREVSAEPTRLGWRRVVPPIGGELQDLNRAGKILVILRIAFTGFVVLLLVILGMVTVLSLVR